MTTQRDFAAAVPLRFTDAFHAEEIDPDQYLAGCYVAALCEQCRNTSGGVATVRLADVAGLLRMDVEHLRRKLRALEPEWVELDTTKGRGAVWKVRLTGLVWEPRGKTTPADSRDEFHRNATESTPPEWNFNSTGGISADGAKPVPERDSTGSEIPLEASGEHPTRHDTTQHNPQPRT